MLLIRGQRLSFFLDIQRPNLITGLSGWFPDYFFGYFSLSSVGGEGRYGCKWYISTVMHRPGRQTCVFLPFCVPCLFCFLVAWAAVVWVATLLILWRILKCIRVVRSNMMVLNHPAHGHSRNGSGDIRIHTKKNKNVDDTFFTGIVKKPFLSWVVKIKLIPQDPTDCFGPLPAYLMVDQLVVDKTSLQYFPVSSG